MPLLFVAVLITCADLFGQLMVAVQAALLMGFPL